MSARKTRVEHALREALQHAVSHDVKDPRVRAATMITVGKVELNVDLSVAQDNYTDPAFELVELDYANKKIIVRNGTPDTTISHATEDPTVTITRDDTSAATRGANDGPTGAEPCSTWSVT